MLCLSCKLPPVFELEAPTCVFSSAFEMLLFSCGVEAGKLKVRLARQEHAKCVVGAASALHNLEVVCKEREEVEMQHLVAAARAETAKVKMHPWKRLRKVDEYNAQYDPEVCLKRRKTLILDGASRNGKSEFAWAMADEGEAVELNCSNCIEEPPLQGFYEPLVHNVILFDEMKASVMVRNKRLFQAPDKWVAMGTSKTNCYTYKAWVFRKKLVVSSNNWKKELKQLSRADRDWIKKNTIYVRVNNPLWDETGGVRS